MQGSSRSLSSQPHYNGLDALISRLHADERVARAALTTGCEADLGQLDELIARRLRATRPTLQSAVSCRRSLEDNANLRLRARFALYGSALVEAEAAFINGICGLLPEREWLRLRPQRRFPLPHLDLCGVALPKPLPIGASTASQSTWVDELATALRETLRAEAEHARDVVAHRGAASLSRVQVVVALTVRRVGMTPALASSMD